MNENVKYYDDNDNNEINTNSDNIINKKINMSLNINAKSTAFDDNILLNTDIPDSNITNYIQSYPSSMNQLYKMDGIHEKSEISLQHQEKPIIDNLSEEIDIKIINKIKGMSIIPIGTIKDSTLSSDCNLGLSIVPSSLMIEIMKIDANNVLLPLLNIQKSCFRRLSVEDIMTWQKSELTNSLLRMEQEFDKQTSMQMFRNLLSYMKDRDSSKKPLSHASKYIRMVKASNPILRDEAYLQIYKQLHKIKREKAY
jgi:hypothetical protein